MKKAGAARRPRPFVAPFLFLREPSALLVVLGGTPGVGTAGVGAAGVRALGEAMRLDLVPALLLVGLAALLLGHPLGRSLALLHGTLLSVVSQKLGDDP